MVRDLSSDKEAQGGVETLCVKSYEEVGFEFVGKAGVIGAGPSFWAMHAHE